MGKLWKRASLATPIFVLALAAASSPAAAQPLDPEDVPAPLQPWIPWVLDGYPDRTCTSLESAAGSDATSDRRCVWPSELVLEVSDEGARFQLDVIADHATDVTLPGGPGAWPREVRIGRDVTAVGGDGETPFVVVAEGHARIEGRIAWSEMPETLPVPGDVARVVLVMDGERSIVSRASDGDVWLRAPTPAAAAETVEADTVRLEVHRRIDDGSPLTLTTRITVRASGHPRELSLGSILPAGAVPVEVESAAPTRLSESGELTIQISAGTLTATVRAFVPDPEAPLRRPALPEPWPAQEVWVFVPDEAFRQAEITGASGIDPERTTLPDAWRSYSAYLVDAETELGIASTRRGAPTPPPNEMSLRREVWLDFDGSGASVRDWITLEMHRGFRLELLEGELGRVSADGADQIITRATEEGRPGIEVRATRGPITGEWRIEGSIGSLPAVAWSENATDAATVLNLPPGWELIHASSVDRAPYTWTDRWTLLGFFALLVIAIAVGRVFGPQWGAVALVGVGLSYYEDDAPIWTWLVLAGLLALQRALAARAAERWVRYAYVVVGIAAVWWTVPFATIQLRNALFPILDSDAVGYYAALEAELEEETPEWLEAEYDDEGGSGMRHRDDEGAMGEETSERTVNRYGIEGPADTDPHMAREMARSAGAIGALAAIDGSWSSPTSPYASNANWLDPTSVVQTGFGTPSWTWRAYELGFDGPVLSDQRIELWLAPPWLTRLVAFLRAGLLLALLVAAALLRPRPPAPGAQTKDNERAAPAAGAKAAVAAVAAMTLAIGLSAPGVAHAQSGTVPPADVLRELGERLTRDPICGDRCAEASAMTIEARRNAIVIEIHVEALARAVYPIPGPTETWAPNRISLDGHPADALVRLGSGFVYARVPAGAHTLRIEGSLARRDSVTLSLGRVPRALRVETEGWESTGTGTDERVAESISLTRTEDNDAGDDEEPEAGEPENGEEERASGSGGSHVALPAWLEVTRTLDIGVRWTIESTVTRRSPLGAPAVVRIPLLEGESVTDASVVAEDGFAVVNLAANESEVSWTSVLEVGEVPQIVLTAPSSGRVSEKWRLACSPLWHCETAGIAPTSAESGGYPSTWLPSFDPWPGESVTITLSRPHPVEGITTTVDDARLEVDPGARMTLATLELTVRTSVSTPLSIGLPEGAEVAEVRVDGGERPIHVEAGALSISLQPGEHSVHVEWQEPGGLGALYTTPTVTIGEAAVNLALVVEVPDDRWMLWIAGPAWGPVVLFWPYLLMVLTVAALLSRRRSLLPKAHQWALLGLGLACVPPPVALIVVGWFFLIEWRKSDPLPGWARFDARQVLLVLYTLVWFGALVGAVENGLLERPDMDIAGPDSWAQHLRFFVDRSDGALPTATVVSLPAWVYRVLRFVWAAWLAVATIKWVRDGWGAFSQGDLWRNRPRKSPAQGAGAAATGAGATQSSAAATPSASEAAPAADAPRETATGAETSEDAPAGEPDRDGEHEGTGAESGEDGGEDE